MTKRDYPSETLTVHWDSELCIHSGHCIQSLRAVFDNKRRPWVWVEGAADEAIRETVEGCPSRALTYTLHEDSTGEDSTGDGPANEDPAAENPTSAGAAEPDAEQPAAAGSAESAPAPRVTVTPQEDGPLEVIGEVTLLAPDGTEVRRSRKVYLCRCGHSRSKPFCDGSHKRFGFRDPGLPSG